MTVRQTTRSWLRWITNPAVDEVPQGHAFGATALRLLLGLMWLFNVNWKVPPHFGKDDGGGLFLFTSFAVSHPVFPPYSWLVEHVILPNIEVFGWMVLVTETTLTVLLLTGTYVRVAGAMGIAMSTAIAFSVALGPGEWPWSYALMIGGHIAIMFSSAGRVLALDAVRAGLARGTRLLQGWGALAVLMGLITIVGSLKDPLAARGFQVGSGEFMVGLGQYNVVGGAVLLVTGALMLVASRAGAAMGPRLAIVGAGLAVIAALSLHVQVGFSDPLLGGSATSAALFFCLAVVAAVVSTKLSEVSTAGHTPVPTAAE